jgi:RNA polymerase sigma-70 factor (ECF subfamily)
MVPEDSFTSLMTRLQARDEDAAARVFQRFAHRLAGLARLHLDERLRRKVDPEDVLQSVFRSFFLRQGEGQFVLKSWDGLWALLTVITIRKCGRVAEHFRAAKRDYRVEVRAGSSATEPGVEELFAADPSPEEAALLTDLVERLLRDLGKQDGEILSLALQGFTPGEIAQRLDRPTRIIRRALQRIKSHLHRMQREPSGESE